MADLQWSAMTDKQKLTVLRSELTKVQRHMGEA